MESIKTKFRRLGYRIKRWLNQDRMVFLVAIAMCLIWTWGAISAMSRNWELEQRLVARRQELTLLQLEIDSLELENRYYASEEYQELTARTKQNKQNPGETLIYLPDNTNYAKHKYDDVSAKETSSEEPSNFEQWFNFVFGL